MNPQPEPAKRPGRPPGTKAPSSKTVTARLRCLPEQRDRWQAKADRANLSLSAWIAQTLDRARK